MPRPYEGSHQQYDAFVETDVMIPMRDGVRLATDHYFPGAGASSGTLSVRGGVVRLCQGGP